MLVTNPLIRILIIHQGALGDLILSLPVLYSLRLYYDRAFWVMAGNPETGSLLHNRFYAQEVVSIHNKEWAGLFLEESTIPDSFREFLSSFQKAYVFSSHYPEILNNGLKRAGLKETHWLPSFPDLNRGIPLQVQQKAILRSANIPWLNPPITVFPSDQDRQAGREYLDRMPSKDGVQGLWWAIHPGSGSPRKNWPWERFMDVAHGISAQKQAQPFFLIGPVEQEASPKMAQEIEDRGFPILRNISLPVLAGVLSHCAGYLGNDSGVSHLAAALGIPTVLLFGPTDPEIWGPKGNLVRILRPDLPCAPCSLEAARICPEKACLLSLSVRQVLDRILPIVQG